MSNNLSVVFLVRRFGLCGGMESYVWNLANQLVDLGVPIYLICEEVVDNNQNAKVILVPQSKSARSFKRLLHFRSQCEQIVPKLRRAIPNLIVHSHERALNSDVTTAHGALFNPKTTKLGSLFSYRIRSWLKMQYEDLSRAKVIVPVSGLISGQIATYYGTPISEKLSKPGVPGVNQQKKKPRRNHRDCGRRKIIGFVGKEWKRKGLSTVVAVCSFLKIAGIDLVLEVYGPSPQDVPKRILSLEWVTVHGWCSDIPYSEFDALMLLSEAEPFGMVILEALLEGVPCLISKHVGASSHVSDGCLIFEGFVDHALLERFLSLMNCDVPELEWWTWRDVAQWHVREIYGPILAGDKGHQ